MAFDVKSVTTKFCFSSRRLECRWKGS